MIDISQYNNEFIIEEDAEEKFEWIVNTLPDPWKTEFIEDVLVYKDSYDFRTLNKVFMYYIEDLMYDELPEEVQDEINSKYIMIKLN